MPTTVSWDSLRRTSDISAPVPKNSAPDAQKSFRIYHNCIRIWAFTSSLSGVPLFHSRIDSASQTKCFEISGRLREPTVWPPSRTNAERAHLAKRRQHAGHYGVRAFHFMCFLSAETSSASIRKTGYLLSLSNQALYWSASRSKGFHPTTC